MRFLLLTLEYPPFYGGVANYYYNLQANCPSEHSLEVISNDNDRLISKIPLINWLPAFFLIVKKFRNKEFDHLLIGHVLPLGTAAYFAKLFYGVEYSLFFHGMDFAFSQKTFRKNIVAKKIIDNAYKIVCTNSYVKELIQKITSNKEIYVNNPGVNNRQNDNNIDIKNKYNLQNSTIILSVGRLVERKGFDSVIETLPELTKNFPNLTYVVIGKGEYLNKLKILSENLDVQKNILFLQDVNENERDAWLKNCDVFVMPSRNIDGDFEGFGIVYLEANLAGKPVVAGDSGGVRDSVEHNVSGLLVDPENKLELIDAIAELLTDKNLYQKLSIEGQKRAIEKFNSQGQALKFYSIFK